MTPEMREKAKAWLADRFRLEPYSPLPLQWLGEALAALEAAEKRETAASDLIAERWPAGGPKPDIFWMVQHSISATNKECISLAVELDAERRLVDRLAEFIQAVPEARTVAWKNELLAAYAEARKTS